MGLINAAFQPRPTIVRDPTLQQNPMMGGAGGPMPQMPPPQMPQGGGGLMGAFSQNPQFQQQLGGIMGGQSPGFQPPPMTQPRVQFNPVTAGPTQSNGPLGGGIPQLWGLNGLLRSS